jgi:hypothetical protein
LRTRLDRKYPDVFRRLGRILDSLAQGQQFAAPFRREFGLSPEQAEQKVVEWLGSTEGNPAARLSGTIFAEP